MLYEPVQELPVLCKESTTEAFHIDDFMDRYGDLNRIPPVDLYTGNMVTDVDEYVRCSRCGYGGCDVRVSSCGCTLHAVRFC
jgi:hypothetical protein